MQYTARLSWTHQSHTPFTAKEYDRTHQIHFGSGLSIEASSAPEFVGNATLPNPEELFTASVASCFMLTLLYYAALKNLPIEEYTLEAIGILAKNAEGKMAMTEILLTPHVRLKNNNPIDINLFNELLKKAHEHCFISCSIKTKITIQTEK